MSKKFVGVDLHKRFCHFTELDSEGNVTKRGKFGNNIEEVSSFAASLAPNTKLTVEPLLNYLWFLDQVEPYVKSVHPAHPYKVRAIAEAKCKTDRLDALMLAELLRTDFLPESYYVPQEIRGLRNLVRQRFHLVNHRRMLKSRMRYLLFLNGSEIKAKDVSSPKAQKEMKQLGLPDGIRRSLKQCQRLIEVFDKEIELLEEEIADDYGDVEEIKILRSVTGIALIWAATIYSEIVDINRFRSKKALVSYTGLAPIIRASGDKVRSGGITHCGSSLLRTALVEAAVTAWKKSPNLKALYYRVLHKRGLQTARVAVARKLAIIIYVILKERRLFKV